MGGGGGGSPQGGVGVPSRQDEGGSFLDLLVLAGSGEEHHEAPGQRRLLLQGRRGE